MKAVKDILLISAAVVALTIPSSLSFTVSSRRIGDSRNGSIRMAFIDTPPIQPVNVDISVSPFARTVSNSIIASPTNNALNEHLVRWSATNIDASSTSPSTMLLSIQEYRKPTAEEIAAKKFTFNLWFWGGGIVAPFLATIYYFGFKFWER
jgi:hypothetical protein